MAERHGSAAGASFAASGATSSSSSSSLPSSAASSASCSSSPFSSLEVAPPVREISSSSVLFLLQEIVKYSFRRSMLLSSASACPNEASPSKPAARKQERKEPRMPMLEQPSVPSCSQEFAAISMLEEIGFSLGFRAVERLSLRNLRVGDERGLMKFICKDLWLLLFLKQADRLQTNRRGGYVVQDNSNTWLRTLPASGSQSASKLSASSPVRLPSAPLQASSSSQSLAAPTWPPPAAGATQAAEDLPPFASSAICPATWVCGVVRGALAKWGVASAVGADVSASPSLLLTVRLSDSEQ
eukprot:GHVT01008402.1.p1 GENE.GHVT01008402.1~~GHVT01008402.1.p1  ORF type:complete len:299 (+),score=108.37 GHVT01008402.1:601-1497(+)